MAIRNIKKRYDNLTVMAKASLWAFFSSMIQRGVSILATPIYTRILAPEEYAQYTLYQSWFVIWVIFGSLQVFGYSTYNALARFDDRDGFISSAVGVIVNLTVLCFVVCSLLSYIFGDFMGFPPYISACLFLDVLFYSVYSLWAARERYGYKYKLMTVLAVVVGVCEPILGIALTCQEGCRKYGRIYGVIAIHLVVGFALFVSIIRKSGKIFCLEYWKYIFRFGLPLLPHLLAVQILIRLDRFMINSLCGASDAGIYGLAYNLSMLMMIVSNAVLNSFTPWTHHEMKKNYGNIRDGADKVLLLVGVANVLLMLFAPEAVRIFATAEYSQAVYIIPAVSASVYYIFLAELFVNIEYYFSETRFVAMASGGAAASNVFLNLIFIPRYGFIAAGYTTLMSYMLYAMGHFVFMRIVSKKHARGYRFYNDKWILMLSAAFTIAALLVIPLYEHTIIRYVLILSMILAMGCNWKKIVFLVKRQGADGKME